jgi:hypothetical protein
MARAGVDSGGESEISGDSRGLIMAIASGISTNIEICKILGIDPNLVTKVVIEYAVDSISEVQITRFITINEDLQIRKSITEQYNLIKKPDNRGYVPEKGAGGE